MRLGGDALLYSSDVFSKAGWWYCTGNAVVDGVAASNFVMLDDECGEPDAAASERFHWQARFILPS